MHRLRAPFYLSVGLSVLLAAAVPAACAQSSTSMAGGVRAAALGGAATALPGDVWGVANPAAWATLSGRALSFFASEAFGMEAMRLAAAHYVEPTRLGTFAGGAQTFGFEDFRETHFNAGYARSLHMGTSRALHVGVNVRYYRVALGGGYGSAGAAGLSLGGMVMLLPSLYLGAHATNVNVPKLAGREELPRTLAVGLSYAASDRLLVLIDGYKDIDEPLSVRGGLEIYPVEVLALRAGIATQPTRFTVGMGLHLDRLRAGVAAEHHLALGWSPAASLGLQW